MRSLLNILMLLFCCAVYGQKFESISEKIDLSNDLTTNTIYCTFQDSRGNVWIGTDAGLFRYNGYEMKQYTVANGLADNDVFIISEDPNGRLWVLSNSANITLVEDGKFSQIELEMKPSGYLSAITHSGDTTYIGSSRGMCVVLQKKQVLFSQHFQDNIRKIVKRGTGEVTFFGNYKNITYDSKTAEFTQENTGRSHQLLRLDFLNQTLAYAFDHTVILDREDTLLKFELPEDASVLSCQFVHNDLYVGTRSGLFHLDMQDKADIKMTRTLTDEQISFVYPDRSGNMWISTLNNGIYKIPNSAKVLLKGNKLSAIRLYKNDIWAATTNEQVYHLTDSTHTHHSFPGFKTDRITSIKDCGELWLTGKSGIIRFSDEATLTYPFWANDLCFWQGDIYLTGEHTLRMDSARFISQMSPQIDQQLSWETIKSQFDLVDIPDRSSTLLSYHDQLYVATKNGLWKLTQNDLNGQPQKIESGNITGLTNFRKKVYFYSQHKGFFEISQNGNKTQLSLLNNAIEESVNFIKSFDDTLWIGSTSFLYAYTEDGKLINKSEELQLKAFHFNDIAFKKQFLYACTNNGLIKINRNKPHISKANLVLVIDSIQINGTKIQAGRQIELRENKDILDINFTAAEMNSFHEPVYYYRLSSDGDDGEWQKTTGRNLRFESLNSGSYVLEIKAVSGDSASQIIRFYLTVSPPFWKTSWFTLLTFALGVILIFVFIQIRLKRIRKKHQLQRAIDEKDREKMRLELEVSELEMKAWRMQMNPHFIFNALNTIKGYYASDQREQANNYIVKFSKLLRNVLESGEKVIRIEKEIEILEQYIYLAQLRHNKGFRYQISTSEDLPIEHLKIPPMLIQPIVENAILHGLTRESDNELYVNFTACSEGILIEVTDNGVGFKQHSRPGAHKSVSLELTRKRLAKLTEIFDTPAYMKIDMAFPDEQHVGTKVSIIIPEIWDYPLS